MEEGYFLAYSDGRGNIESKSGKPVKHRDDIKVYGSTIGEWIYGYVENDNEELESID